MAYVTICNIPQPKVTPNMQTATLKYQKQNNKEMLLKKGLRNAPFPSIHPSSEPTIPFPNVIWWEKGKEGNL